MKQHITAPSAILLFALSAAAGGADSSNDIERPLIQVFLGVLELDDQNGQWEDISDSGVDVDFSSLPSGGIETEFAFGRDWVHWGINAGGSVAWKSDDTNFSGGFTEETGGVLRVDVDNSLFLFELHLGGYVRGRLADRVTTYAAAGPMVMYGRHEVEDERAEQLPAGDPVDDVPDIKDSDSDDVNIGYYARAGVDFEIGKNQHMGLGLRYMSTELDFDKTVGKIDIEGPQYVFTYTARF